MVCRTVAHMSVPVEWDIRSMSEVTCSGYISVARPSFSLEIEISNAGGTAS